MPKSRLCQKSLKQSRSQVPQTSPCPLSLGLNSILQWTAFSLVSFCWQHTYRSPPCCPSHPLWVSVLTILMPPLQAQGMLLYSSWAAHPSLYTSFLHLSSVRSSLIQPNWPPGLTHSLAHWGGLSLCFENTFLGLFCPLGQFPMGFCLLLPWTMQHLPFWSPEVLLPYLHQDFKIPLVIHIEFGLLFSINNIFSKNKAYYICSYFSKDDSFKNLKVNKKKK